MSVCAEISIVCDLCGSQNDSADISVGCARVRAREDGWRRRKIDGKWLDICDRCLDQQNNAECDDALSQVVQS